MEKSLSEGMEKNMLRLDKYLADSSTSSRKDVRRDIKSGAVSVNGRVVKDPSFYVNEENDVVLVGEDRVKYRKYVYLMMYKPQNVLTATVDSHGAATFADYIGDDYSFFNVTAAGRLDIDAEGFLLLTNDGAFVHEIITPERHVEKKYFCRISGELKKNSAEMFEKGIQFEDGYICMPAKIEIMKVQSSEDGITEAVVTVCEGHFHQVKKMVAVCGGKVVFLKRISIGGVLLDENLKPGEYRELTEEELNLLKKERN